MSGPLRFGLVGAGNIASAYAQAFAGVEGAVLAAVADTRPEAARALANGLGCPAFASHVALAAGCPLDAVVVCTPPATHAAISLFFLGLGVHVLCEKPLSTDLTSAWTMAWAARRSGTLFTMASKFRCVEDVARAKSLVEAGEIGDVVQADNCFTARVEMASRWNSDPAVSGGGVLIDNGTHSVDLMRLFLGPLVDVQAVEGPRLQGLAVEESVRLFVRNRRGALGCAELSWSLPREQESYLTLYGTRGVIEVGWRQSRWRPAGAGAWIPFGAGYDKVRAFSRQIDNFARAIRGEEDLLVTMEDALASVEVVEAAYRALRHSRWTPLGGDPQSFAPLAAFDRFNLPEGGRA
ncbi:MAG TPA: Gfo/Idh/MocA family oxidoreductase [Thermoanaerobaculia bacterium]